MTSPTQVETSELVGVPRQGLHALCAALYRDLGGNAAAYLQEAGYAAGVSDAFERWLSAETGLTADALDVGQFSEYASRFFAASGWGSLALGSIGDAATVDSEDWAEANPSNPMAFPACYFSAGMLAEFFGRVSGMPVAAMEVECRSSGASRCRFLVGSPELMQRVYDGFGAGVGYEETCQS